MGIDFPTLYHQHVRFVLRSLRAHGVSEANLRDVGQEVFMVAHRRWSELSTVDNQRGWLYGTARRVAANHRRSHARREARETGVVEPSYDERTPEHAASISSELAQVQATLDELDPDARDLFFLYFIENLTSREIAQLLELNVHTVNSRLRAIRKRCLSTRDDRPAPRLVTSPVEVCRG